MAQPNKRFKGGLTFVASDATEIRLDKGYLEQGLVISMAYQDVISGAATAARPYGIPVRRVQLLVDGGKALHVAEPTDLVREAEIFEQAARAAILAPPTALGPATVTGTMDLPLMFRSSHAIDPEQTDLPTWIYDETILRMDWGAHADLYVGGTGTVTATSGPQVGQMGVQERVPGDPFEWGRVLRRLTRQFKDVAAPGVANSEFQIEVQRTAPIRALLIVTEDANGEPVNTIINAITLELNGTVRQLSRVPGRMLRSDNAKLYGVTMPTGVYVVDFAEDGVIAPNDILDATRMSLVNLILDVAAVAGTIRVHQIRLEPGPGQA